MSHIDEIGIRDIEASYTAVVQARLDEALAGAADDVAALAILRDLRRQTLAGMTWDEAGISSNLSDINHSEFGEGVATQVVTTHSASSATMRNSHSRSHYLMMLLCAGVLLWVGLTIWQSKATSESNSFVIADRTPIEANTEIVVRDDWGGEWELARPVNLWFETSDGRGVMLAVRTEDYATNQENEAVWQRNSVVNYHMTLDHKVWQTITTGVEVVLEIENGERLGFICQEKKVSGENDGQRPGITLFPASAKTSNQAWWCPYDLHGESAVGSVVAQETGISLDTVVAEELLNGRIAVQLSGEIWSTEGQEEVVSLALLVAERRYGAQGGHYRIDGEKRGWVAQFGPLPEETWGEAAVLEVSRVGRNVTHVQLEPWLKPKLDVDLSQGVWHEQRDEMILEVMLTNRSDVGLRIRQEEIETTQGGLRLPLSIEGEWPTLISSGEEVVVRLVIRPSSVNNNAVIIKIAETVWEVTQLSQD